MIEQYTSPAVVNNSQEPWLVGEGVSLSGSIAIPSLDFNFVTNAFPGTVTFSRASSATMFDSSGTLVYAPMNLLLQSEDFSTGWITSQSTLTAASGIAPNGTNTAGKLVLNNGSTAASTRAAYQNISGVTGVNTVSIFAKAVEFNVLRISILSAANTTLTGPDFTLSGAGSFGALGSATSASITPVGNGWYRCVATFDFLTGATAARTYYASAQATGDGTSGILIWGAQLNQTPMQGGVTGDLSTYYPTTSAAYQGPRLDYDPATLLPRGFLVEEQRTNLLLYSTDLSTGWAKGTAATWTLNAATAPDGTMTALQGNGIAGTGLISTGTTLYRLGNTVSGSTAYTFSVYVRTQTGTATNVRLRLNETGGNNTLSPDLTVTTAWTRFSLTVTTAAGATAMSTLVGTGSGTADLYIWGAQLEAGAFSTSYIPTTTTALTRSADVAAVNTLSPWFNGTEGTLFGEFVWEGLKSVVGQSYVQFDDGTTNNRWIFAAGSTNQHQVTTVSGGTSDGSNTTPTTIYVTGSTYKIAAALAANDLQSFINGTAGTTDTSVTLPVGLNNLKLGASLSATANIWLRRLTYYPRRLSQAEGQAITA